VIAGKRKNQCVARGDLPLKLQAVFGIARSVEGMRSRYIIWRRERYPLRRQGRRDPVVRSSLRETAQHSVGRTSCDGLCTACALGNRSRVHGRKIPVGEGKEGLLEDKAWKTVGKQSYAASHDGFSIPAKVQIKPHARLHDCLFYRRGKAVVPRGKGCVVGRVQSCGSIREPSKILRVATIVANRIAVAIDADAIVEDEPRGRPPLILGINSKVIDGVVNVAKPRKALFKVRTSASGQRRPSLIRDATEVIVTAISGCPQTDVGEVIPLEVKSEFNTMVPFYPGKAVGYLVLRSVRSLRKVVPSCSQGGGVRRKGELPDTCQ
jgi:hypothetical protein